MHDRCRQKSPYVFFFLSSRISMNAKLKILVIAVSVMACSENINPQRYDPDSFVTGGSVGFQVFYDNLSPYGAWVSYPPYGYVWIPEVAVGFSPYVTNGYWIYTRYGWTWNSYYSWGWAPFHYGRWHLDAGYGWMWIPDTVWGPGWVAWRMGGGYCGWAPLGPNISVTVVINGGHRIPHEHWIFVNDRDFTNHHIERHRLDRSSNSAIMERAVLLDHTREERNVVYQPGPDRDEVQRIVNRSINTVEIQERSRPGRAEISDTRLEIYKPDIKRESSSKPPRRIYKLDELNKQSERSIPQRQRAIIKPPRVEQRQQPLPKIQQPQRERSIIKKAPAPKPRKRSN